MPIKPIFIKFPPITISWTPKGPAGSIAMMELWQFRGRVAYWLTGAVANGWLEFKTLM
jgi:hypothetical protein